MRYVLKNSDDLKLKMKFVLKKNKKSANKDNRITDSLINNGQSELSNILKLNDNKDSEDTSHNSKLCFESNLINKKLPKELIIRIFSYLDIVSLCRCAQVCKVISIFFGIHS